MTARTRSRAARGARRASPTGCSAACVTWPRFVALPAIDAALAGDGLEMLEVDTAGLDEMDRKLLRCLIEKFDGGPVGLGTLATALGEEPDTLEDVYEPYLIQEGYLDRTRRGRVATRHAYGHLGVTPPPSQPQGDLFPR